MITQSTAVRQRILGLVADSLLRFSAYEQAMLDTWAALIPTTTLDEKSKVALRQRLVSVIRESVSKEEIILVDASTALVEQAGLKRDAELDMSLYALIDTTLDKLNGKLTSDARVIASAMDRTLLAAFMESKSSTLPIQELIRSAYLVEKKRIQFGYTNRANRVWGAVLFLTTTLMDHYYLTLNDYAVSSLVRKGFSRGRVEAPGSSYDGKVITLSDYFDLRKEIFHPQSVALVLEGVQ